MVLKCRDHCIKYIYLIRTVSFQRNPYRGRTRILCCSNQTKIPLYTRYSTSAASGSHYNYFTCITGVPTFSLSSTVGLYELQSGNRGALLLMSLTSTITRPVFCRLIVLPQQLPSSVAVTLSRYATRLLSRESTSVMIPELGSMMKGWELSWPPGDKKKFVERVWIIT